MPEDIGEYRYYHPIIDGPLKLVRGTQFNSNADVYRFLKPLGGDIARAPFSLVPSEPMDTENFAPSMSGEMLVNKIQEFANDSFQVKRIRELKYLRAKVNSWFLVAQQQPLELSSIVLADPAGNYWLDYALLIDDEKQGRKDLTGTQLLVTSGFRLFNESGELIAEDAEDRAYAAFDKSSGQLQFRPFLVANRLPMIPGKYKLEVHVTNREAGKNWHVPGRKIYRGRASGPGLDERGVARRFGPERGKTGWGDAVSVFRCAIRARGGPAFRLQA